jgi:hypothetical protein
MIRVVIIDKDGKVFSPNELAVAAELRAAAEQARDMIRECERLARLKESTTPAAKKAGVPYLS